jgi:hypothetical protein
VHAWKKNRQQQNCPIDDEGLRFYYSSDGTVDESLHPFPIRTKHNIKNVKFLAPKDFWSCASLAFRDGDAWSECGSAYIASMEERMGVG